MITLHWTAGHYDQLFDDYHMCIDGSGSVHVMQDLDNRASHCYRENTNNFGISACSNYGSDKWRWLHWLFDLRCQVQNQ